MFEEIEDTDSPGMNFTLPPMPKILIVDMSLITGMDTSTVDIFTDIKELCVNNICKLYLCGLSPRIRAGLALGGVKPERGAHSDRSVRFFHDLDSALGKAEDLLTRDLEEKDDTVLNGLRPRLMSEGDNGFRFALKQIDEQYGQEFAQGLMELQPFTVPIELEAGDYLFQRDGGLVQDSQRGLFFIESGLLKIERDASGTLTRGRGSISRNQSALTLSNLHARMGSVRRKSTRGQTSQNFRLARIGPGW
jgi:hypothetical protein